MRRNNDNIEVFDASGNLADEFVSGYPRTAKRLEELSAGEVLDLSGDLEGFRAEEDPRAAFHEQLRRNSEGQDPAPGVSDEALWAEWTKHREAHDG